MRGKAPACSDRSIPRLPLWAGRLFDDGASSEAPSLCSLCIYMLVPARANESTVAAAAMKSPASIWIIDATIKTPNKGRHCFAWLVSDLSCFPESLLAAAQRSKSILIHFTLYPFTPTQPAKQWRPLPLVTEVAEGAVHSSCLRFGLPPRMQNPSKP